MMILILIGNLINLFSLLQFFSFSDINKELEMMKQLLKEIVTKITENLLGKSINDSSLERQTTDESRSVCFLKS